MLDLKPNDWVQICCVKDNEIYVNNPDTKIISMSVFFEEDMPDLVFASKDCDCKPPTEDPCTNPLDREFKSPGYLLDSITRMVSQKLLTTYFKIPEDPTSNEQDEQVQNAKK